MHRIGAATLVAVSAIVLLPIGVLRGSTPTQTASVALGVPSGSLPDECQTAESHSAVLAVDTSLFESERAISFAGRSVPLLELTHWLDRASDGPWQTYFNWMQWLVPVAERDPAMGVELFLARAEAVPDPGASVGMRELARTGWDEASVMKRLRVAGCLWRLTEDPDLRKPIDALVSATMDPLRYNGRPMRRPHNHGLMSNTTLFQIGRIFQRADWQDFAIARAQVDASMAFDRCGLALEQSLTYADTNLRMWTGAAAAMGLPLVSPGTLAAGSRSLAALTEVTGSREPIGDGTATMGHAASARSLWCPHSGWAAGTTGESHYIVRGGPRRWAHGHEDHGAMTWSVAGIPVLSDRGSPSKFDPSAAQWAASMSAHSVLEPSGVTESGRTRMDATSDHSYVLQDRPDGSTRRREIVFSGTRLDVRDSAAAPASPLPSVDWTWTQHWQLAPGWTPTSAGATYLDGSALVISCDGGAIDYVPVTSYAVAGLPQSAWDVQCVASGRRVVMHTTLKVVPA